MNSKRKIQGSLCAPASKSMTQRAIAAALLAPGASEVRNPSQCSDALAAVDAAGILGAQIETTAAGYRITGVPQTRFPLPETGISLHVRESALCARLFAPVAALLYPAAAITGSGTLLRRPMDDLITALAAFGVTATAAGNRYLPLQLHGALQHGTATVDASASSQIISGLLMTLPLLQGDSEITVKKLASRPYVDMTLELLQTFGIAVENNGYERFGIRGNQRYTPQTCTVEGDWSGAAFWLAAAAVGGEITMEGLHAGSAQADRAILQVLQQVGAQLQWADGALTVRRGSLNAFRFNASDCPDLFPPVALLAAFCNGISIIEGAERLAHKESNRAAALQDTFGKLGVTITIEKNEMAVHGGSVHGGKVSSFHDHRIAMAAACAGLFTDEAVEIDDTRCVNKSYPAFFTDMETITRANVTNVLM
ncbi:MAG: 3-phosphoshikimate 1-carboxyvinyltransferase [Prevotellaceae bacterium]|jgi:3-phosphoshikimate 1-carboxyvinyltransferase|nr:3-phosphoshikimate 1-carboxyvinyltransferase [Prevotellaceae bacterium]